MPQIVVQTTGPEPSEVFRERVQPIDLESQTSTRLLMERLGWAISDATHIEHDPPAPELESGQNKD